VPGPQTSLDFDNKLKPFTAEDLERLPPDLPLTDPQAAAKKNQAAQEAHDPMTLDKVLDLPVLHAIRRLLEHIGKHAVPPLHESSTAQPSSQLLALAARLDSLTEQLQLQAGDSSHLTTDINNRTQQNMGQI